MMNIRTKDLNLLVVFVTVAEELNLSRASKRIGLSQPALSHALSRLRLEFDDRLFIRSQRGLIATPKVATLLPRVRSLLEAAEGIYETEMSFGPARVERKVTLAATTYFEAQMISRLTQVLSEEAPKISLETRALSGGFPKAELESGEYDLAIAAYFLDLPESFKVRTLLKDPFVCVGSKKNPYHHAKRSIETYLNCKHLQIEVPAGVFAPVDQRLKEIGRQRKIVIRIGNFLTPPSILNESDLLLTCPLSLATRYSEMYPLAISDLPFRLPLLETKMVWHEKNQKDAFHSWLRDRVSDSVSTE